MSAASVAGMRARLDEVSRDLIEEMRQRRLGDFGSRSVILDRVAQILTVERTVLAAEAAAEAAAQAEAAVPARAAWAACREAVGNSPLAAAEALADLECLATTSAADLERRFSGLLGVAKGLSPDERDRVLGRVLRGVLAALGGKP